MISRRLTAIAISFTLYSASASFAATYYCSSDMRTNPIYFSAPFDAQNASYAEVRGAWQTYLKQKYSYDPPADHQSGCYGSGLASDLGKTQSTEEKRLGVLKQSPKRQVIETGWALGSTNGAPPMSARATETTSSRSSAHTATPAPGRAQQNATPTVSIEQMSDETLNIASGKNGTFHESTEGATMTRVRKELERRANDLKDGNAAYSLARDMQYPTIAEWTGSRAAAKPWYVLSYKLGNVNGKYRVGSYYISGEFPDMPKNPRLGDQLMSEAHSDPAWDAGSLMKPDRGGVPADFHFREGSHDSNALGSGSSTDRLLNVLINGAVIGVAKGVSGNAALPTIGNGGQDTCHITETTIMYPGTVNAHPVTSTRLGQGSECH